MCPPLLAGYCPAGRLGWADLRGVGGVVAETLVDHFGSIEAIAHADAEALEAVDGIGPILAQSVVDWFASPHNQIIKIRTMH